MAFAAAISRSATEAKYFRAFFVLNQKKVSGTAALIVLDEFAHFLGLA